MAIVWKKNYISYEDVIDLIDAYLANAPFDDITVEEMLYELQAKLKECKELTEEDLRKKGILK